MAVILVARQQRALATTVRGGKGLACKAVSKVIVNSSITVKNPKQTTKTPHQQQNKEIKPK